MTEPGKTTEHLLWALQERAKELSCIYEVEELLNNSETPLSEVFSGVVRAFPPGWQYPEICQARIEYAGQTFVPEEFTESPWVQSADIVVQDRVVGRISVYYTKEMPQADEGPFLKEEGKLIRTIADRLGHFIQHQELRTLVQDWRQAADAVATRGTSEWRVGMNLLRRTDQELFVRISRKLANHLSWSGIAEAHPLLHGLGGDRGGESGQVGEHNEPSLRRPLDASLELADRVFALASSYLSEEEILARIQRWMHEDRSSFVVKTVMDPRSSPGEIVDAIRRYLHLTPEGTGFSLPLLANMRVALIRRFLSEEPGYVAVAKRFIGLEDMVGLLERLVCLPDSPGRVGGKAAGMFLARLILQRCGDEKCEKVRTPETWYVATDASLAFIRYNNLEEVFEQKYKEVDQVRLQYPHLVQVFKNSSFPPEIVKDLSVALDELHSGPLIVRSSSLLEDRLGAAFSGKYKSLFLPNRGSKGERLTALLDAVAEVYASIFSPDPIQYRAERGLLDFREEMGILIQEVVGTQVSHYYLPAWAGVAVSHNEFRWSPRIKREDGLIRLVPGLGTRAVDRLRDDYPVLIAPGQPGLRVNASPDEIVRYAPRCLDAIDLEGRCMSTVDVATLLREAGDAYPEVHRVVSLVEDDRIVKPTGRWLDFAGKRAIVTFEGLVADTPWVLCVGGVLRHLERELGHAVEIEFASDGQELFLLQCRPQTAARGMVAAAIPRDVPDDRVLFTADRYVSNGRVGDITHIVYIDPDRYHDLGDTADLLAVGRAVAKLNQVLPKRQFILMGPGRWGSRGDIRLGVNVTYSDISNTALLVEIARQRGSYLPDLSFGTHFFQDLVEASIRYLPLYPDDEGTKFNERFFLTANNELPGLLPEFEPLADVLRVIDIPRATRGQLLRVLMNAELDSAIGMLVEPGRPPDEPADETSVVDGSAENHWRWRLRMAERIAGQLDAARFGVAAMYVIGSAKNATAGPASDIDLLVHVRGSDEQLRDLRLWLEGWSLCLDEMNYLRTGYRSGGLLDVHVLTDIDVEARSSYAVKIGAVTDAAWELAVKRPG
ncbi:MAG: PEP/pyruvate-binding domain-containing protein [Acidobacteriota bacterium]